MQASNKGDFHDSREIRILIFDPYNQMMTCCKRNDKSKLVNEDSSDEGNFVKQSNVKPTTLLDPKAGVLSDALSAISFIVGRQKETPC